jgi:hypothetical protein
MFNNIFLPLFCHAERQAAIVTKSVLGNIASKAAKGVTSMSVSNIAEQMLSFTMQNAKLASLSREYSDHNIYMKSNIYFWKMIKNNLNIKKLQDAKLLLKVKH